MSTICNKTKIEIFDHLDGITESQLLENSPLIYALGETSKTNDFLNYIRFNNSITLGQLNTELDKIKSLQESVNVVTESTQANNLSMFQTVIESAIRRKTNVKCAVTEHMINFLECQMFDDYSDYIYSQPVLTGLNTSRASNILQFEDSRDKISPKGLAKLTQLMCDPCSPFCNSDKKEDIKNCLKDKIHRTMKYEMDHNEYNDIPIIHAISYVRDFMKDVYDGFEDIIDELDDIFDDIEDYIKEDLEYYLREESIDAQFNPDPFNVYNLCPFPVGVRTVHRSLMNIAAAETDEELDEAMMEYARLENAITHSVNEASTGSAISKTVRHAGRITSRATDDTKTINRKGAQFSKDVSNITAPMLKYIEEINDKLREADSEERRNFIIKGSGVIPKTLRWLKRGLGLLFVGSLGSTGALIAVISLLTMIATDAVLDGKERTRILRELENELAIVEEKIEDSRGDENKQKKYELIRIRNKLRTDIERIKLRLRV